ncbi:MAG: hypothetical protein HC845_04380 [Akkermansiaceae bacterium]|nr:hypothetical protein [Akkermansiaceae bacterium]
MKAKYLIKRTNILSVALGMIAAVSVTTAQAAVNVISDVTFDSTTNLYRYSYSIQNTGLLDLILLTIPTDSLANVTNISPATGFSLTYDRIAQVNSFFEDNDIFTDNTFAPGLTVSPFVFNSPLAPLSVTYTAFDVSGAEFSGTTVSPIPETSSALLGGVAIIAAVARRRRNS